MQDIVITKIIDVPIERVFKANTDPKDLKQWCSAGNGWTTPFAETDLRGGGFIRVGFASPDGKDDFVLEGKIQEISEPTKLVYTLGEDRTVTMTLEELGDQTKYTIAFTPEQENSEEMQRQGWTAIADNLIKYLKEEN